MTTRTLNEDLSHSSSLKLWSVNRPHAAIFTAVNMLLIFFILMAATAYCQLVLYPNGTQFATTLSSQCTTAIGASLNCDPYLQGLAETNYYGSLNDNALQASICEPNCGSSLSQYHSVIASSCSTEPQPWDGIPATWAGDALWATWNRTCLKDPKTGDYCSGMHGIL